MKICHNMWRRNLKISKKTKIKFQKSSYSNTRFAFKENIPDIRNTKIFEMTDYFRKKM